MQENIRKQPIYSLKYEPRDEQIDALEFVKHNIRRGKKYMMLNAPTGIGKSYFSVMLMNWYTMYINSDAKFDLLTNSKILQNQYVNEFPFIKSLKGQNSYLCNTYGGSCQEGKELNKALKRKCSNCPYDEAFREWMESKVSLTNFHLFNTYHLFLPQVIENKQCNVLIIDEAHDFESVLCDFITMRITERSLKSYGFSDSRILGIKKHLYRVKNVYQFVDFINEFFLLELDMLLDNMQGRLSDNRISSSEKLKTSKYITSIHGAIESYKKFIKSIEEDEGDINNWVLEVTKEEKSEKGREPLLDKSYIIQPIWSNKYLHNYIWKYYDHIIFMSGTILDKSMFSYLNGLEPKLTAYYDIKSPFVVKRRPIYYIKVGKMTFTEKEHTFKKQVKVLDKIVNRNDNKKGIIHTFNYEISNWLKEYYKDDDRFLFHTPDDRDVILEKHIKSKSPTILVSPSMMNGVDLKDDLSRFQVMLKIPYPNIKSEKIKKRQMDNKDWYNWKTVVDIIQSYGRSIRSVDDWCETYVLDESLSNIMKYNYKYLPEYFTEAIKTLK
jgi:ATP-dependent DNA helicase DinG